MKNTILSILAALSLMAPAAIAQAAPTPGPQTVTLAMGESVVLQTPDFNNSFKITYTGLAPQPMCVTVPCQFPPAANFTIQTKGGLQTDTTIEVGGKFVGSSVRIALNKIDVDNSVNITAELYRLEGAHPLGTNIIASDGTIYTMTTEQLRRPYSSAGAYLSYGFNSFANAVPANAADMAIALGPITAPQDGRVVCSDRGTDRGTCYLMTNGKKAGFVSEAVFHGQGYSFSRALYGDVSFMARDANIESATEAHRPGALVNNNGTVQMIYRPDNNPGHLVGFPSLTVFDNWGFFLADVVPANAADRMLTQDRVLFERRPGDLHVDLTGWANMTE